MLSRFVTAFLPRSKRPLVPWLRLQSAVILEPRKSVEILPEGKLQANIFDEYCCYFSVAQSYLTLCDPMDCSTPGLPVHHQLQPFIQTHVHRVGDAIQPSHPLVPFSSFSLESFPASGSFPMSQLCIEWSKCWSFNLSISPSNEHSGLISFRMAWLDLLAVQGTLRSLLQHHSSKAPVLQHSAFFMVQLSHLYVTPGKTIALTR